MSTNFSAKNSINVKIIIINRPHYLKKLTQRKSNGNLNNKLRINREKSSQIWMAQGWKPSLWVPREAKD